MKNENKPYLQFQKDCEDFTQRAIAFLQKYQAESTIYQMKDEADLATTADIEAEKLLISLIHEKYPVHAIESEESGYLTGASGYLWIVDPLDGTKEYARGLTEYNCLLAVEEKGELIAAAICRSSNNELYSCAKDYGAILNGNPIAVSQTSDIARSFVGFHLPTKSNASTYIARTTNLLEKLIKCVYRIRPGWDDAKHLGLVARGVFDAHIICANVNKWHDIASGLLLVAEAGGTVTDWSGYPLKNHNLSGGILASNGKIHEQLLRIIGLSP